MIGAVMLSATACSTVKEILGIKDSAPATTETTTTAAAVTTATATASATTTNTAGTTVKPATPSTAKDSRKADKATRKKDKKDSAASTSSKPQTRKPTTDELVGGQWNIIGMGDVKINDDEDTPYVNFDRDGRFYASDGCNIINGTYALRSDGTITFGNVLSTMKYCPEVEYSAPVSAIFNSTTPLSTDCRRIGQDTYLYLKGAKGNTLATLCRHNMEFLNGNWQVTAIDGKKINDEEANIFIDIAELKIHGNTGCNFFNGNLYIDPARSNAIDFNNIGLTRMACPKMEQEQAMVLALEQTASAISGRNSQTVLLLDSKGKEVLTLKRIPIPKAE